MTFLKGSVSAFSLLKALSVKVCARGSLEKAAMALKVAADFRKKRLFIFNTLQTGNFKTIYGLT
jgi:RNase P/RNase MRP subunit POP5